MAYCLLARWVVCWLVRLFLVTHPAFLKHEGIRLIMNLLLHSWQFRCTAAFLRSAHARKRVVAGLESERATILSLEMAAGDVQATRRNHVTRKPVTVGNNLHVQAVYVLFMCVCAGVRFLLYFFPFCDATSAIRSAIIFNVW